MNLPEIGAPRTSVWNNVYYAIVSSRTSTVPTPAFSPTFKINHSLVISMKRKQRKSRESGVPIQRAARNAPNRRGLLLTELLVVIRITALLVAITVPAVQWPREQSRAAACQNNLWRCSRPPGRKSSPAAHADDSGN